MICMLAHFKRSPFLGVSSNPFSVLIIFNIRSIVGDCLQWVKWRLLTCRLRWVLSLRMLKRIRHELKSLLVKVWWHTNPTLPGDVQMAWFPCHLHPTIIRSFTLGLWVSMWRDGGLCIMIHSQVVCSELCPHNFLFIFNF